jgi:(2R)-ethylmalonyl-CoA mutase
MGLRETPRERPWLFRTYAGHSSAAESNHLFRTNLARGQTGLSVAFDLPTQTGYDSDHPLAAGEVGRVGAPVCALPDMLGLFEGIPLERMNTSMTINATAPWLLALYIVVAERQGVERARLAGTVQNDLIKEYLSRGTYIFPPRPSLKLTGDVVAFTYREMPKWNPVNVCSYHLQEAGATPVQELAYALATATAILDTVRESGQVPPADLAGVVGRISFFVNAGLRFVTEMCKMRAFAELWDEIARERYGVEDAKLRRFRYGVQVNSLGLTEQQPENNVHRILLEMLAVVLSKSARARAVQLPAWNEALGLPRPWDQQWSLRMQQILAYETDLLDYDDLFEGSPVVAAKVEELKAEARAELARIEALGGALAAVETGYIKQRLVESNAVRLAAIASGEQKVVGVNCFTESAPSPLAAGADGGFLAVDAAAEASQIERLKAHRAARDERAVAKALRQLHEAASEGRNVMVPSIECARAGATTGEWTAVLREVFGDYRAPTGIGGARTSPGTAAEFRAVRARVEALSARLGRRLKMLVGKPGLDGHSNGAEQIAVAARDCGFEVVYDGIRLTPARIATAALEEGVHVVGLSILSGSHRAQVAEVLSRMRAEGLLDVPLVVGGIVPPQDAADLLAAGVARVFTPKDYQLAKVMAEIVGLLEEPVESLQPA